MFKVSLKFKVLLGLVLLMFSASGMAASYCIYFPSGGNSHWSTRDNDIKIRFKYDLKVKHGNKTVMHTVHRYTDQNGRLGGKGTWHTFGYGQQKVCLHSEEVRGHEQWRINNEEVRGTKRFKSGSYPQISNVQGQVKWGDDCRVHEGEFRGHHNANQEIWRRKGNHIFPFDCDYKFHGLD